MRLSINIKSPSSDALDSELSRAITNCAAIMARKAQRGELPGGPGLDLTFLMPGKFEKPDFTGMRMGGYTDDEQVLYFETAVPEEIVFSPQAGRYVALTLEDVVANAGDFFADSSRLFDSENWYKAVANMALPQ